VDGWPKRAVSLVASRLPQPHSWWTATLTQSGQRRGFDLDQGASWRALVMVDCPPALSRNAMRRDHCLEPAPDDATVWQISVGYGHPSGALGNRMPQQRSKI
jgi:hypothetical protein